jgi:hypothetical protein
VVVAAAVVLLAGAAAVVAVREAGSGPADAAASGLVGSIALGGTVAVPALLALLGNRARDWVLVAAGLMLLGPASLSVAIVIAFVPALALAGIGIARLSLGRGTPGAQPIAAGLCVVFVVAAIVSLFAHQDPASWTTATESGSTSDVVTMAEALTAIGFLTASLAIGWLAPRTTT